MRERMEIMRRRKTEEVTRGGRREMRKNRER